MERDSKFMFRINSELKKKASEIVEKEGYSFSDFLNAACMDLVSRGQIMLYYKRHLPNRYQMQNEITIALIKLYLDEIVSKYDKGNIKKVYLFGSFARGEERPDSDIDLRLEFDDKLSFKDLANIRLDLKDMTGRDVDLIAEHEDKLDQSFLNEIRKDEICLYECR